MNPWILAARPRTLPLAAAPVLVGSAVAVHDDRFRLLPALACLAGALLLQIGANFANDLSDFRRGADTAERVGPVRVTQAGLLKPEAVRNGAVLAFGLAVLVGAYLVWLGGWPIAAIGLSGILSAVTYVGGPLPYGYRGLGELFVFLYFGLAAVVGTYYVQAGTTSLLAWWSAFPIGASAAAVLVVNNIRDRHTDAAAGKRTLAVLFGDRFCRFLYMGLLATTWLVAIWPFGLSGRSVVGTVAFVGAGALSAMLYTQDGPALNPLLGRTALFGLAYAILYSIAIAAE